MSERETPTGAGSERIPPEQWIPEPPHDYVDWMDKEDGIAFSDLSEEEQKEFLDSLPPERRVKYTGKVETPEEEAPEGEAPVTGPPPEPV